MSIMSPFRIRIFGLIADKYCKSSLAWHPNVPKWMSDKTTISNFLFFNFLQFFQIKKIAENIYHFGGRVKIKKLEEVFDIKFDDSDFETIGGLVNHAFNTIPEIGDKIEKYNLAFKIKIGRAHV